MISALFFFSARYLICFLFIPFIWIWFKFKDKTTVVRALISVAFAIGIAEAIKLILPTPRPFVNDGSPSPIPILGWAPESSFPSAHTSGAFSLALSVFLKYRKLGIILLILGLLVGLSRILIGVHYWWDILGGMILGSLVAWVSYQIHARRHCEERRDVAI